MKTLALQKDQQTQSFDLTNAHNIELRIGFLGLALLLSQLVLELFLLYGRCLADLLELLLKLDNP
jgi:hypothetical protein